MSPAIGIGNSIVFPKGTAGGSFTPAPPPPMRELFALLTEGGDRILAEDHQIGPRILEYDV